MKSVENMKSIRDKLARILRLVRFVLWERLDGESHQWFAAIRLPGNTQLDWCIVITHIRLIRRENIAIFQPRFWTQQGYNPFREKLEVLQMLSGNVVSSREHVLKIAENSASPKFIVL